MRIRSIKPEFWTSTSISNLDIEDRLLFVGIWSYVDDNGVGLDRLSLIATDLFPDDIERDPRDTFARVSRGLANLSEAGRIVRYAVDDRDYLAVVNWTEHQRIDKPAKARYPAPTTPNAVIRDTLATLSRHLPETPATGAGEQGNRGAGEQGTKDSSATASPDPDLFEEFWDVYDKKRDKKTAAQKWKLAIKKPGITPEYLIEHAGRYIATQKRADAHPQFTMDPARWLGKDRWTDEDITTGATAPEAQPARHPSLDVRLNQQRLRETRGAMNAGVIPHDQAQIDTLVKLITDAGGEAA